VETRHGPCAGAAPFTHFAGMSLRSAALFILVSMAWGCGADPEPPPPPRAPVWPYPIPGYEQYYSTDPDEPTIELVTMGVGALIWERHGHIALCVRYGRRGRDACYNYGVAEFHKPLNMAWAFFRGSNGFWVEPQSTAQLIRTYVYRDRTVWVQPLPLTPEQKRKVIEKLEYDDHDEHRYYAYDHFLDNCTTRVRDIIDDATGGALRAMNEPTDDRTFRDLAREGFFGKRIPLLVTDLAMGRSTDRVPTYWERMFLPDYLRVAVEKKWGIKPYVLYERRGTPPLKEGPSGRVLLALVILALTAPAWATRLWGRFQRAGLAVAVVPYVLFGSVLWFLAAISPLDYVRWNETCLILFPLDIALIAFLAPARRRIYARFRVGMLVLLALLDAVSVIRAPLLAPILWPLIPCLVVGFWPERRAAAAGKLGLAAEDEQDGQGEKGEKGDKADKGGQGGQGGKAGKGEKVGKAGGQGGKSGKSGKRR
jgi:Domain of unknown function (DUF4105)